MATRDDVAKRAGVSTCTVSHVLNGTRYVSDPLKERVLQAVEELGYVPNLLAKGLTTNKSNMVALFVNDISNPYYGKVAIGMESAALAEGYILMLCIGQSNIDRYIESFIMRKVEGVFISSMGGRLTHKHLQMLTDYGIATVLGGVEIYGLAKEFEGKVSCIHFDFDDGMSQAITHLAELGHKNIAYLNGLSPNLPDARLGAFQRKTAAMGLHGTVCYSQREYDNSGDTGYRMMQAVLENRSANNITAVIATNDVMAMGALSCIRENGYSSPEDYALIGFDNISFGLPSALTTVETDQDSLGRTAFRLVADIIDKGEFGKVHLPVRLIVRETTAGAGKKQGKGRSRC